MRIVADFPQGIPDMKVLMTPLNISITKLEIASIVAASSAAIVTLIMSNPFKKTRNRRMGEHRVLRLLMIMIQTNPPLLSRTTLSAKLQIHNPSPPGFGSLPSITPRDGLLNQHLSILPINNPDIAEYN